MSERKHIQHIKSSISGKAPSADNLAYGEFGINYAAGEEAIYIKNSDNEVVKVGGYKYGKNTGTEGGGSVTVDDVTIKEGDDGIYAVDTILKNDLKVTMGSNLGNLSKSITIPSGTSVLDILKQILCKTINPTTQNPSASLNVNQPWTATTYEVGTVFNASSRTLTASYTDGKFKSSDTSAWSYSVNAGCANGAYNIKSGTTSVQNTTATTYTLPSKEYVGSESEQTIGTFSVTVPYSASTTQAVDSNGAKYSLSIAANSATSSSVTVKVPACKYKYYLGYSTVTAYSSLNSDSIKNLKTKSDWVTINGTTTIVGDSSIKSNGNSIVIACPKTYKLATAQNGIGGDIMGNFTSEGLVSVKIGGTTSIDYKVYVYPITNGAVVEIKKITLTKNN